jgi:hypothetical protein
MENFNPCLKELKSQKKRKLTNSYKLSARRYKFWYKYERKIHEIYEKMFEHQKLMVEMDLKYMPLNSGVFRKEKNLIEKYMENDSPPESPYGYYGDSCYLYRVNYKEFERKVMSPIVHERLAKYLKEVKKA